VRRWTAVVALLVWGGFGDAARAAGEPRDVAVGPVPAWVLPEPARQPEPLEGGDIEYEVRDVQTRITAAGTQHFHRQVWKLLSQAGLESSAELRVAFDPVYQRLTLHELWIERDGRRISMLNKDEVRVFQRETGMDDRLYDGRLTALQLLRDARVGDVVGATYTLEGANPVFQGHVVEEAALQGLDPTGAWRYRLLVPVGHALHYRLSRGELEPQVREHDGQRELIWSQQGVAAFSGEDRAPPEAVPPLLVITDFADWGALARWASGLFATSTPGRALRAKLGALRALPSPEARLLGALRFVQDDVRYLGLEMGTASHRPHPPDQVLEQRFGDCKDKALLLTLLLRGLDIDAEVALVATDWRERVAELPPSPWLFDHAIVRARLDGQTYWLDATRTLEGGPLAALTPPHLGKALVVSEATTALEDLPPPSLPPLDVDVSEVIREDAQGKVTMDVHTRYLGTRADLMRRTLASVRLEALGKRYLDYYALDFPGLKSLAALQAKDDRANNIIDVFERYALPKIWDDDGQAHLDGWLIEEELPKPRVRERREGLVVDASHVRETLRLETPKYLPFAGEDLHVAGAGLEFRMRYRPSSHTAEVVLELEAQPQVRAPKDVGPYLAKIDEIRRSSDLRVPQEGPQPAPADPVGAPAPATARSAAPTSSSPSAGSDGPTQGEIVMLLVITAVSIVLLAAARIGPEGASAAWQGFRNRRRRQAFDRKFEMDAGTSAATALEVPSPSEPALALNRVRCTCGGGLSPAREGQPEAIRFEGRTVWRIGAECSRCKAARSVYVAVRESA
jgi:hypothetical protein